MHFLNAIIVYLLKVNYDYDRRNYGIWSKLSVKTLERSQLTPQRYLGALIRLRSSHLTCSMKKLLLKILLFSQKKHLCWSLFLIKFGGGGDFRPAFLLESVSNAGVSLWIQYCKIFKNIYFETHLQTAASVDCKNFYRATENQIKTKFE